MKQPLISIAIPVYNAEEYISYAIQSVINQTYSNWELLIIDDGSTDNSISVARSYNDFRIEIYSDGKNKGLPSRLNESIKWAKGKYYARMDADDIMHYKRLETQMFFLETHPEIDVLGSSMYSIDANNKLMYERLIDTQNDTTIFLHPSVIGKLSWFLQHPYNLKMKKAQDVELWLRTKKCSTFYSAGDKLVFYREFGVPTFRKYTKTMLYVLYYLYLHPYKYNIGIVYAIRNIIYSCGKILVCGLFTMLKRTDLMISLRKKQLIKDLRTAQIDLDRSITQGNCIG